MISRTLSKVTKVNQSMLRAFSKSADFSSTERPAGDRVMSTPQWPAPYYQRMFRSYPVRQEQSVQLDGVGAPFCQMTIYEAKRVLSSTPYGAQMVSHVEDNIELDSYVMRQTDTGRMAKAYVSDLVEFIDVANKENKRILAKTNLF